MVTNNNLNQSSPGFQSLSVGVFTGRTITPTSNQTSVSNGNGTGGNPTVSLTSTIYTNISFDTGTDTLAAFATGTFSPTLTAATTNPTVTYAKQVGYYQNYGEQVTVNINIALATLSGGSGIVHLDNFPFTCVNVSNYNAGGRLLMQNTPFLGTAQWYDGRISTNVAFAPVFGSKPAGNITGLQASGLTSTSSFACSITYNI